MDFWLYKALLRLKSLNALSKLAFACLVAATALDTLYPNKLSSKLAYG